MTKFIRKQDVAESPRVYSERLGVLHSELEDLKNSIMNLRSLIDPLASFSGKTDQEDAIQNCVSEINEQQEYLLKYIERLGKLSSSGVVYIMYNVSSNGTMPVEIGLDRLEETFRLFTEDARTSRLYASGVLLEVSLANSINEAIEAFYSHLFDESPENTQTFSTSYDPQSSDFIEQIISDFAEGDLESEDRDSDIDEEVEKLSEERERLVSSWLSEEDFIESSGNFLENNPQNRMLAAVALIDRAIGALRASSN
jgi:hypothetical protein